MKISAVVFFIIPLNNTFQFNQVASLGVVAQCSQNRLSARVNLKCIQKHFHNEPEICLPNHALCIKPVRVICSDSSGKNSVIISSQFSIFLFFFSSLGLLINYFVILSNSLKNGIKFLI